MIFLRWGHALVEGKERGECKIELEILKQTNGSVEGED